MAENIQDSDWKNLAEDDFINKLIPDPKNTDINVITGVFLGKGTDAKVVRLYTTLQLNQYMQIPIDKILGAKRFPSGQIVIWIPGDLKVQVITTATLSGDFLKGNLQSSFSGQGGGLSGISQLLARAAGGGGGSNTFFAGCRTDVADPGGDPTCTLASSCFCPPPPSGCRC